jgi:hypothetical protein
VTWMLGGELANVQHTGREISSAMWSRWFCTVLVLHKLQLYAGPVVDHCARRHVAARLIVFLKRQPGSCMRIRLTSYQSRTKLTSAHPTRHSLLGSAGCEACFGGGAPHSGTVPDARRLLPPAPQSCADVFLCDAQMLHLGASRMAWLVVRLPLQDTRAEFYTQVRTRPATRSALCFQSRAHRGRMHSRGKAYCCL